jgi:DNA-binding response OmpR family regulator
VDVVVQGGNAYVLTAADGTSSLVVIDIATGDELGALDLLLKPISLYVLKDRVKRVSAQHLASIA